MDQIETAKINLEIWISSHLCFFIISSMSCFLTSLHSLLYLAASDSLPVRGPDIWLWSCNIIIPLINRIIINTKTHFNISLPTPKHQIRKLCWASSQGTPTTLIYWWSWESKGFKITRKFIMNFSSIFFSLPTFLDRIPVRLIYSYSYNLIFGSYLRSFLGALGLTTGLPVTIKEFVWYSIM